MTKLNYLPPKGFRDIQPVKASVRQKIIKKAYDLALSFGFNLIETPTIEYRSVLMGKYGQEADKLIFNFTDRGGRQVALRYDQTVPLGRYVNRFRPKLPFKRCQIQPAFRAEKPQKGRYREFVQIDFDIVGDGSLASDAEILLMTAKLFDSLKLPTMIYFNSRPDLYALFRSVKLAKKDYARAAQIIDKLDKRSDIDVQQELKSQLNLTSGQVDDLWSAFNQAKPNSRLTQVLSLIGKLTQAKFIYSPFLARGLDYYTDLIFEAKADSGSTSVAGGGRYDKLIKQTGNYLPAVGVGIGLDRIVNLLQVSQSFQPEAVDSVVLILSDEVIDYAFWVADKLRQSNQKVFLYPPTNKIMVKGWKYAQEIKAKQVVFVGQDEKKGGYITIKRLDDKKQSQLKLA